jgi:hypothetical protein
LATRQSVPSGSVPEITSVVAVVAARASAAPTTAAANTTSSAINPSEKRRAKLTRMDTSLSGGGAGRITRR